MKFKEFVNWCNERACDGCWSMETAILCIGIIEEIRKIPFWRRKKIWAEQEKFILEEIVQPINQKMKELGLMI